MAATILTSSLLPPQVAALLLVASASSRVVSGQSIQARDAKPSMPNLSGDAAKSYLEKDGSYHSLISAVQKETGAMTEFSQTRKLLASDGTGHENFARTVAVSGDTAVISSRKPGTGTNVHQGAAYVFERNWGGANAWGEVKKLVAPDANSTEEFGASLAISGDTIVIGKLLEMVGGVQVAGGAYVYERHLGGPNNWGLVKRISASDATGPNYFGVSVSISGNTIAVGASRDNIGGVPRGSVYIYERDAGGADNWGETRKVLPSDGAQLDQFGAVALHGGQLIVGALGAVVNGNEQQGAAYIFSRDAGGANNWGEVKKLIAPDGTVNAGFGKFVDITDNTAIVGAGIFSPSAVYVFERGAGGLNNWGQVKKLTTDHAGQGVSSAASLDGDRIVIGEPNELIAPSPFPGAAYLFERNQGGSGNWGRVKKLAATDTNVALNFGNSVAVSGKTILIGAQNESTFTGIQSRGAAYLFQTETQTWIQQSKPLPVSCTVDDRFGYSVSVSGSTAIVGAPHADVGSNANQGAAYIFERDQGGAGAWGLVKVLSQPEGAANDLFGHSVSVSGDKAVVGSPFDDVDMPKDQGSVTIFERNQGGANNWGWTHQIFNGPVIGVDEWFGYSVAINAGTLVIGTPFDKNDAGVSQGAAYIWDLSGAAPGFVKKLLASDRGLNDAFGSSVSVDGNSIVVGAWFKSSYQGAAYVFDRDAGGANNWGEVRKLTGDSVGSLFGRQVAISGDTVVVGTYTGLVADSAAYVFGRNSGGVNNWGRVKKLVPADASSNDFFGSAVAIEGNTIAVGSWFDSSESANARGSVYVFGQDAGGPNNWGQTAKLNSSDAAAYDFFGASVSISGAAIISGASGDDIGGTVGIGSSYVFTDIGAGWVERAKQVPSLPTDCGTNDNYGYSVAIEGNTAVIGAPADDVGVNQNQGSVYVLERDQGGANGWGIVSVLTAYDGAANEQFGFSVAIKNGVILVGAWQANVGTNNIQGAAYIFERDLGGPNAWGHAKKLTAADGAAVDAFGASVSLDNDIAVVGAHFADVGSNANQGAAYIFSRNTGGANNWGQVTKLVASDGAAESFYGFPVTIYGSTIVVGSPGADIGANQDQGAAYVYERNAGGANNWGQAKKLIAPDGAVGDFFSDYAATVSGDTMVVGARLADINGRADQGAAYIFYRNEGGAGNWGFVKKLIAADGAAGDFFGQAAAISGDTLFIGAPLDDVGGNQNQGSAYVFARNSGGPDNWGQVSRLSDASGGPNDQFSAAVASSGDDFLIGAYLATINQSIAEGTKSLFPPVVQGAAYVYTGTELAPTAAGVSVGGRVLTDESVGISNARVTLTAQDGSTRSAITNGFGYFLFDDIAAGGTYHVRVSHKRYQFAPRTVMVSDDIQDLNFTPTINGLESQVPKVRTQFPKSR